MHAPKLGIRVEVDASSLAAVLLQERLQDGHAERRRARLFPVGIVNQDKAIFGKKGLGNAQSIELISITVLAIVDVNADLRRMRFREILLVIHFVKVMSITFVSVKRRPELAAGA